MSDEEIKEMVMNIGSSDKETQIRLMNELVFDERIIGLSDSCVELMRQLMHPDPKQRLKSDNFLRHPWIQGLTASWKTMGKAHDELKTFWQNKFRTEIKKKFLTEKHVTEKEVTRIFNAMDIKKNGVLDLEEITAVFRELGISDKNIQNIFASVDLDGTGVIHLDEFKALLMSSNKDKKDVRTDDRANEDDDDDDVGPGLHVNYLQQRFKSHILTKFKGSENGAFDLERLREIFNAIDLEGNGVLDPHDIRVVLRSVGEHDDVISRIVASLDVNDRDGRVTWDDFLTIMGRP